MDTNQVAKKSHHKVGEERTATRQRRYTERRDWLNGIKVLAGCKDCGLHTPPEALTFDHVRGEKKFDIGPSWNQGRAAIEAEIAKCEVVCANCHNIRTKASRSAPQFMSFPKIARLSRECFITEKIDGTNATVWVDGEGDVWVGSRTRWITPEDDNHGFAKWVAAHEAEFAELGPSYIRGEWYGGSIQRGYGLKEKRFAVFNPTIDIPSCCERVPLLYRGDFDTSVVETVLQDLRTHGSYAVPGFMRPEGIVVFHTASNWYFKKTLDNDGVPKSKISVDKTVQV